MGLLLAGAPAVEGLEWGVRLASLDILRLIGHAGWIVKLVLLALSAASVVSWAIILLKSRDGRPKRASRASSCITRDPSTRRTRSRAISKRARSRRCSSRHTASWVASR